MVAVFQQSPSHRQLGFLVKLDIFPSTEEAQTTRIEGLIFCELMSLIGLALPCTATKRIVDLKFPSARDSGALLCNVSFLDLR